MLLHNITTITTINMTIIIVIIVMCIISGQNITPEIAKVKFHWTVPGSVRWALPLSIHWESDNPLEHTTEQWNYVGNSTDNPLEHATKNPRWFLRCRFLMCNILSLGPSIRASLLTPTPTAHEHQGRPFNVLLLQNIQGAWVNPLGCGWGYTIL